MKNIITAITLLGFTALTGCTTFDAYTGEKKNH